MPLSQVYYLHHVCVNFCLNLQIIWYLNLMDRQETLCTCHGPTSCTATPSWRRPLTAWPLPTWTTTPLSWTSSLNGESHSRPKQDSSSTCSWNLHRSGLGWQMLRIRWEIGDWPYFQYLNMLSFRWCYLSSCWTRGCPNPMTSSWVRCTWWRARQTRWRTWLCWSEPPSPSSAWLRRSSYGRGLAVGNPRDSVSSF